MMPKILSKNPPALAVNLKRLREEHGFSQKRLGELAKVPWRSIQNAEAGISDLGADALLALANVFRKTVDELIRSELSSDAVQPPRREITPSEALEVIESTLKEFQKISKNPTIKKVLSLPPDRAKLVDAVLSEQTNVVQIMPENFKKLMQLIPDDQELWQLLLNADQRDWDAVKRELRGRAKARAKFLDQKTLTKLKHSNSD